MKYVMACCIVCAWAQPMLGEQPFGHSTSLAACPTGSLLSDWTIARALFLDGLDDHVVVPDHEELRLQAITLSAWVNTADAELQQPIVAKALAPGNWVSYMLRVQDGGRLSLLIEDADQARSAHWRTHNKLSSNAWHHLAATWQNRRGDATDAAIYLDGVKQDLEMTRCMGYDATFSAGYSAEPLYVGRDQFPSGHFRGWIVNLEITGRVLNETEIGRGAEELRQVFTTLSRRGG